jgi:hypothetical protein
MLKMNAADRARYLAHNPASTTFRMEPASRGFSGLRDRFSEPLRVLMVLVGIVLLIACANVANLLLARANARQREIAVRLAIGAGRFRILRQLLTESLLLSLAGGGLGLAFALWSSRVLIGMLTQGQTPLPLEITPDPRVLAFTLGVSLLAALLFGLAPALRATRLGVHGALSQSRPTGRFTRFELSKLVVVIEMALSVPLLIGAGLFIGTLRNLAKIDRQTRRYPIGGLHGYELSVERLGEIVDRLAATREKRRDDVPGLSAERADSIVGGAVAIQTLAEFVRAKHILVSGQGVREGIVLALMKIAQRSTYHTEVVERRG